MGHENLLSTRIIPHLNVWSVPHELLPPASIADAVQRSLNQAKENHAALRAERSHEALRLGQRFSGQEAIRRSPNANAYDLRGLVLMIEG